MSLVDPGGNVVSITDAFGGTTTLEHDVLDRLVTTTDALGQPASRAYGRFRPDEVLSAVPREEPVHPR